MGGWVGGREGRTGGVVDAAERESCFQCEKSSFEFKEVVFFGVGALGLTP